MKTHIEPTSPERAPLTTWQCEPPSGEVRRAVDRIRRAPDVVQVAVMPDLHLASEVCVGCVVATRNTIYPAAVGGDIGCGVCTMRFGAAASTLADDLHAEVALRTLAQLVPVLKHRRPKPLPPSLLEQPLSAPDLRRLSAREGALQLGTLGRGNHFLEFQADADGGLWVMIHSGSRAMGPAVQRHHQRSASRVGSGLATLNAQSGAGRAYLDDMRWCEGYARANRRAMMDVVTKMLAHLFDLPPDEETYLDCSHNHVRLENHANRALWTHRKGANDARDGARAVIPGSMGTASYHVVGRGCAEALNSSSHGAGRRMSRTEARHRVSPKALLRQLGDVRFDREQTRHLVEEAPAAYRDIDAVMRAQRELVRVERMVRPVLSYKGV